MAISMDDVNSLVWRYLKESGFSHSAFLFESESMVDSSDSTASQIPSGALIALLQKSLLYMKMEKIIKHALADPNNPYHEQILEIQKMFPAVMATKIERPQSPPKSHNVKINSTTAIILQGHKNSVFGCNWSPSGNILATSSADGTAILWDIKDGQLCGKNTLGGYAESSNNAGITTVDWDRGGKYFATGSFDKTVRLYSASGTLLATLNGHKHNVFAVRFNPSGNFIVTCSADHTAILWVVASATKLHVFDHHTDTILDVEWKDNVTFATASADNTVGICNVNGGDHFLRGHSHHVTAVSWSASGSLLASASEDQTVRVWREGMDAIVLPGHEAGVSCVKWVPNSDTMLISSSQDGSVRIWSAIKGECLRCIKRHTRDVISIAISPNGEYIASGGTDQTIDVSKISDGEHISTFYGQSSIFEVQWDPSGQYIAACFDDPNVAVIPMNTYIAKI